LVFKIKQMIALYFDPGTGALIVQFLAAVVAGVVLFYKTLTYKIKSLFGIKDKETDSFLEDIETEESEEETK
jgi:hypothetical protein